MCDFRNVQCCAVELHVVSPRSDCIWCGCRYSLRDSVLSHGFLLLHAEMTNQGPAERGSSFFVQSRQHLLRSTMEKLRMDKVLIQPALTSNKWRRTANTAVVVLRIKSQVARIGIDRWCNVGTQGRHQGPDVSGSAAEWKSGCRAMWYGTYMCSEVHGPGRLDVVVHVTGEICVLDVNKDDWIQEYSRSSGEA